MLVLIPVSTSLSRPKAYFYARMLAMITLLVIFTGQAKSADESATKQGEQAARQYFTDVPLINHSGRQQAFYSDLLKDKVVIIHSFFTSCKSVCPVSMKLMAGIQQRFADDMGKKLFILSFSLDPKIDTPLKLQAYAQELKTGPGWQLISGSKENVEFALKKIGHYVDDIEDHKNTLILGNEATGLWKKAFLLAKPDTLVQLIREVLTDQLPVTASLDEA